MIHEDYRSHTDYFSKVKMRSHGRWIGKTAEIVRMVAVKLRLFDWIDGALLWGWGGLYEAKHGRRDRSKEAYYYSD